MQLLVQNPALLLAVVFVLGLIIGSFLNVIIYRLPKRMDTELGAACAERMGQESEYRPNYWFGLEYLINPPSTCPSCGHRIKPWENIPVISYLLQKGCCASCGSAISIQYPLVELLTAVLSVAVVWHFGADWQSVWALLLTWALISMSVIDFQHKLLPDVLIIPLVWLGVALNLNGLFTDIHSSVFGAMAGYLSLWLIFHLFLIISGKEGMGYGDFKLFALFGAWLGWQFLPQIMLMSSVVGAVFGVSMILFLGRDKSIPIPFGPYLAVVGWIALMWGETINQKYLQIAGLG